VRFKRTLDSLLENNTREKESKVSRRGVPGMVVVDGYSVVESLSSPSFACSSSKKSASSLSTKPDFASSLSTKPASSSKKPSSSVSTKPALSNGWVAMDRRKSSSLKVENGL
jgi:hypothetical protein